MENENNLTSTGRGIKRKKYSKGDTSRSVKPKYGGNDQEKYDTLPDVVLIRIIKYLPIIQWPDLERVDHKFQRSVHSAWRSLRTIRLDRDCITNRSYDQNEILKLILEKLLNRAPNLTSIYGFDIYCSDKCKIDENSVRFLAQFKFLTSLSIFDGASMTISALAQFLATSASRDRLKELNVIISQEPTPALDGQQIQGDLQLLRDAFENIADRSILKLKKLCLVMPKNIDGLGWSYDFLNVINVFLLTKLDLFGVDIYSNQLARLIRRSRQLKELYFNFACPIDCQGSSTNPHGTLIEALKNLKNLSVLSIGYKSKCTDEECFDLLCSNLVELLKYFGRHRQITVLYLIAFFGDLVVEAIADMRFYLTSLHLYLDDADGDSFRNLMQRLVNLKELKICGSILFDEDLSIFFMNLKELECLGLRRFYSYDGDGSLTGFDDLGELAQLENLNEIHISKCHFNETALKAWTRDAKWNLESLEIPDYRDSVTDELLLLFIKKMTGLRRLDLSRSQITDNDLEEISKSCPLLTHVNLAYCDMVTKKGVQYLLDGCMELKWIKLSRHTYIKRGLKTNKYRNIKLIKY